GADTTALGLLEQLLDPNKFELEQASPRRLVSEVIELVEEREPNAVLIVTLPAGGLSHTRHLCKRLKTRGSAPRIVVGRWGAGAAFDNRDEWLNCGADQVATTMTETIQQLEELARHASPARKEKTAAAPHFPPLNSGLLAGSKPASGAS